MNYWPLGPVWYWCTGPTGQFNPDLLALWASLILTCWPFWPVYSDLLALRASLVLMYWPMGPVYS